MNLDSVQFQYDRLSLGRSPMHRVRAVEGDKVVGSLHWDSKKVINLQVNGSHTRQGIATAMWNEGHRVASENARVPKPKHSNDRTDAGDAWARSVGGPLPRRLR